MTFECMSTKDFKALFPISWRQLVDNCIEDGIPLKKIESTDNVDVYLDGGDVYEASLHFEESEAK